LDAIIENSNHLKEHMMLKKHCTVSDLPSSLAIDVANIQACFNAVYKRVKKEEESLFVLKEMKNVITQNQEHNTGFLMSTSQSKCYMYVCCIFTRGNMGRTSYALFGPDNKESKGYVYEIVGSITSAIELLVRMLTDKKTVEVKRYEIQFIKCSCDLLEEDRQKIIRRHISVKQKHKLAKQRREDYAAMEPVKKRAKYANMESCQKKALSIGNAEKYRLMAPTKRRKLSVQNAEKYGLMEPNKKQELRIQNAEKYRRMGSGEKKELIKRIVTWQKERKEEKYFSTQSVDYYIQQFNRGIREGPYYICVVCNGLLYRKTVLAFKKGKYNSSIYLFTSVTSFNGNMYICNTCHVTIEKKNKTSCQAVYNNLAVDDVPPALANLEKFE